MDRRNFFKIVSTVSAGLATNACGNKSNQLIPLLVPDHEIVPGEEQWRPAVCTECGAGCGTLVRVMEGERIVERNGEKFRERVAAVKKIEGNPQDPVSGGRLCARGHAALQSLYNPDRLQAPMQRTGERGKAEFKAITWDEAIAAVAEKLTKVSAAEIVCLTSPDPALYNFLQALGAPAPLTSSLDSFALERKAAAIVHGWQGLPVYDLANARYALGVGADFLGGWASPVYYARQFGHFRQGRSDLRGKLVQAESRLSITAASADEWLPVRPGAEPQFVFAIARLLLDAKLARHADQLPAPVLESLQSADLPALIKACGIDEKRLHRIARELGESEAPLVIAGASVVHTNSLDSLIAAHYLNLLLGANVSAPPAQAQPFSPAAFNHAKAILLNGENPLYTLPAASGAAKALANAEVVVSFGNFIDDSAAYADFLLPTHHALEGHFVRPLYDTQALDKTLTALSSKLNLKPPPAESPAPPQAKAEPSLQIRPADPAGTPDQFPFQLQPYMSLQYHDGRGANLPWMQELPDPASSAMWDLPVEIDPQSAARLSVATGDRLRVESSHGSFDAWAYVHPAALPGVVSMAIGEGHTHYGRYASGRGANPLPILAPIYEPATGVLATGATRVKISKLENPTGELIQFSPQDREQGPWGRK